MSAYIVNKDLIDLLVTVAIEGAPHSRGLRFVFQDEVKVLDANQANHIGQVLVDQNYNSVNYRYEETSPSYVYEYQLVQHIGGESGALIPWGHVLKALSCYEYQSCESPDWDASLAFAICHAIRKKVCERVAGDDAPWEWSRKRAEERYNELKRTA
jgi:hypothetical protein